MVISQSDIDELLNNALDDHEVGGESEGREKVKDEKVYRAPRIEAKRLDFPYKSPIIKSRNVVYNPNNGSSKYSPSNKVVVRSLDNYIEYVTRREQAG